MNKDCLQMCPVYKFGHCAECLCETVCVALNYYIVYAAIQTIRRSKHIKVFLGLFLLRQISCNNEKFINTECFEI